MRLPGLFGGMARRLTGTGSAPAVGTRDRERVARLRVQLEQANRDGERLREQLARLRQTAADADVQRHQLPTAQVVQQLFAARAAARRRRAAIDDGVRQRERDFLRVSDAYRASAEGEGLREATPAGAETVDLAGLTWWVPSGINVRPDQWLRLRSILQAREVAAGGVTLDIGAHVGRTAVARALLGDATAVYAAEPDPLNYACLARTVRGNALGGLVLPDRVAIGACSGPARLQRARHSGGHRLSPAGSGDTGSHIGVACLTLDDWVRTLEIDVDEITFVQVDTQGTEPDVLKGATRLLRCRQIAWQIRIDPERLRQAGHELDAVTAMLTEAFTHFIDLHKRASGPRVRPVSDFARALEYLWVDEAETELLLYSTGA